MSNKISQFPMLSEVKGSEVLPVVQDGANFGTTVNAILDAADNTEKMKKSEELLNVTHETAIAAKVQAAENAEAVRDLDSRTGALEDGREELKNELIEYIDEAKAEFAEDVKQIEANTQNIAHIQTDVLNLNEGLVKVQNDCKSNEDICKANTDAISYLHTTVKGYDAKLENHETRITNLEKSASSMDERIEDNSGSIGVLAAEIEKLKKQSSTNNTSLFDLSEAVSANSETLAAMQRSVENSYSAVMAARQSQDKAASEEAIERKKAIDALRAEFKQALTGVSSEMGALEEGTTNLMSGYVSRQEFAEKTSDFATNEKMSTLVEELAENVNVANKTIYNVQSTVAGLVSSVSALGSNLKDNHELADTVNAKAQELAVLADKVSKMVKDVEAKANEAMAKAAKAVAISTSANVAGTGTRALGQIAKLAERVAALEAKLK